MYFNLSSQDPFFNFENIQNGNYEDFTNKDVDPKFRVVDGFTIDKRGFLWYAARGKLFRYDGVQTLLIAEISSGFRYHFGFMEEIDDTLFMAHQHIPLHYYPLYQNEKEIKIYPLKKNVDEGIFVQHSYTHSDSSRFFGEFSGKIYRRSNVTKKIEHFWTPPDSIGTYTGLVHTNTNVFPNSEKRNHLWISTYNGLFDYDLSTDTWKFYKPEPEKNNCFVADPRGDFAFRDIIQMGESLYLTSWGAGLTEFHIPTKTWSCYRALESSIQLVAAENVLNDIIKLDEEKILIGGKWTWIFDTNTKTYQKLIPRSGDRGFKSSFFIKKIDGVIYFSHSGGGISKLNKYNNQFTTGSIHGVYDEFKKGGIRMEEFDSDGNLYLYNNQCGVVKWDKKTKKSEIIDLIPSYDNIDPIYNTYRRSSSGHYQIDDAEIWSISEGKKDSFIAKLDAGYNHEYFINHILCNNLGNVWIAGHTVIPQYFDKAIEEWVEVWPFSFNRDKKINYYTYDLKEDKNGNIWLSHSEGLSIYRTKEKVLQHVNHYSPLEVNRFEGKQMCFWGDSIFLSNENEIRILDLNGLLKDSFNVKTYFDVSWIGDMKTHRDGTIWFNSDRGIINWDFRRDDYTIFTTFHGLQRNGWIARTTFEEGPNGEYVVSNGNDFAIFHPDSLKNQHDPLPVPYVYQIDLFDGIIDNLYEIDFDTTLVFSPSENYLTLYFSALHLQNGPGVTFEYKLDGYDNQWFKANGELKTNYKNISHGEYTFLLRAKNARGDYGPVYDGLKLKIQPQFYETWYFRFGIILIISSLLYGFFKIKSNAIRKEERLKSDFKEQLSVVKLQALRSQMNPHFLFNCLNSIDNFILTNNAQNASEYLAKFSKLVRNILEYSTYQYISLEQEIQTLELYINMEILRFKNKFEFEITKDDNLNLDIKVPPMLLQPYVENAIWHGLMHKVDGGGLIKININQINKVLVVKITDNGIGRKKSQKMKNKSATKRKSFGMKITSERIRLMNELTGMGGKAETIDLVNEENIPIGTTVCVTIPLR